jgi:cytochrome c5
MMVSSTSSLPVKIISLLIQGSAFLFGGEFKSARRQTNQYMKKSVIIVALGLVFIGCATRKPKQAPPTPAPVPAAAEPIPSHMDRVLASYPNYSLTAFNEGKTLYETNCATCHMLHDPRTQNEFAWNEIVPDMVKKANRKGSTIDSTQQDLILKYVVALSKNPK